MDDVIVIRDLRFGYSREEVLSGIDLTLKQGEVLGILGPNGSGKSTLMAIICGILKNWSGSIEIMGSPLNDYAGKRLARILSYKIGRAHV